MLQCFDIDNHMSRRQRQRVEFEPPSSAGHRALFADAEYRRNEFDEEDTKQFRSLNRAAAAARMPRPRCVGAVPTWLQGGYIVPYKYKYQTQCTLPWIQTGLCCYLLQRDTIYKAYAANNLQLIQAIIDTPWYPADRNKQHPLVSDDSDTFPYFRCPPLFGSHRHPRATPLDHVCSIEMWQLLQRTPWLPADIVDIVRCGTGTFEQRCLAVRLYLDAGVAHVPVDTVAEGVIEVLISSLEGHEQRLIAMIKLFEPFLHRYSLQNNNAVLRSNFALKYPETHAYIFE